MTAGRPTKYSKEYNEQARKLCLLGATTEQLADFFEVSTSTVSKWLVDHPKFSEAVKEGKDLADAEVVESLYQRALGYEHESEEIKVIENQVVRVPITKHYPPDATSMIFWLKNRQKANWRDRQEHTGADGAPINVQLVRFAGDDDGASES